MVPFNNINSEMAMEANTYESHDSVQALADVGLTLALSKGRVERQYQEGWTGDSSGCSKSTFHKARCASCRRCPSGIPHKINGRLASGWR